MTVNIGSTAISKVYVGSTAASKVYLGTTEVWSAGPTFDAAGPGGSAATMAIATATWSHTATAGSTVLVDVVYNAGTVSTISALVRTADYGGVAMTSLGFRSVTNNGNSPYVETFALQNVAGGAQTVSVTAGVVGSGQARRIVCMSTSYTGVSSLGTAQMTSATTGTAMSHAVTSASGQIVHQAFVAVAAITAYNQTSLFNGTVASGPTLQAGDAPGAASVTFSATRSGSGAWASIAIPIS